MGSVNAVDQTITNTTSGGLRIAIDNVGNGQTIYLENGEYSGVNNANLTISKNLTISGKGSNVVIDAKGIGNIFTISSGVTVTLKNLKLINGYNYPDIVYECYGGAINNNGSLSVSNCNFIDNNASARGGAIYNNGSLSVSNCTFTNNRASHVGGAIYSDGRLSVSNCVFTNNKVSGSGGAIYGGNPYVSNCNFTGNRASREGGAIGGKKSSVSNCTFTSNQAYFGGAIDGNKLSVSNCTFISNRAKYGGAIDGGRLFSMISCIFTKNTATSYGGAIIGQNIAVSSSKFTNNQAKIGGALYVSGAYSTRDVLRLNSVTFKNNLVDNNSYSTIYLRMYKTKSYEVTKIKKQGIYHQVTVKNTGKRAIGNKFYIGIYVGEKQIKKLLIKSLMTGKSRIVQVLKRPENKLKIFKVRNKY